MSCPLGAAPDDAASAARGRCPITAALRRTAGALLRIPPVRRVVLAAGGVPFDPAGQSFRRDPYRFYRRLAGRDRVYFARIGCWIVTGYAEAVTALRDPRLGHPDYRSGVRRDARVSALERFQSDVLLARNPPEHTRLRRTVNSVLSAAALERVPAWTRAETERLLDRVEPARRMDVMTDLAFPLAIATIARLLGMSTDHLDELRDRTRVFAAAAFDLNPSPRLVARSRAALEWLQGYFRPLLAERRRTPGADGLGVLIEAHHSGQLDDDELLAHAILLFLAGFETTVGLIGNGMLALLRDPDARRRLAGDPELIPTAIEEFLRYDPPIQYVGRMALEDVRLGDKLIRRGQQLYVLIAAAHRDPLQFPDPDRLDLARRNNRHLAFSGGIHACPGAQLARVEAAAAIPTLIRRLPGMVLRKEGPVWQTSQVRALQSLPIAF